MAETIQTLEELSTLKPTPAPQTPTYVQVLDKQRSEERRVGKEC